MAAIPLKYPCSMIVSGATSSGKSTWLSQLLLEKQVLFEEGSPVWTILYCCGIHSKSYDALERDMPEITFKLGLPSQDDLTTLAARKGRKILVLDDLGRACVRSPEIEAVFTQGMHHLEIAVVMVLQNLYQNGASATTISRNASYFVLFANNSDRQQIATKARQMYPGQARYMVSAYAMATREKYGYLFVDTVPGESRALCLRTRVMADEYPTIYASPPFLP